MGGASFGSYEDNEKMLIKLREFKALSQFFTSSGLLYLK